MARAPLPSRRYAETESQLEAVMFGTQQVRVPFFLYGYNATIREGRVRISKERPFELQR